VEGPVHTDHHEHYTHAIDAIDDIVEETDGELDQIVAEITQVLCNCNFYIMMTPEERIEFEQELANSLTE